MGFLRSQVPGYLPLRQGSHHYKKGFPGVAVEQWRRSAKWGHKGAQLLLGLMYFDGTGVEKDWSAAHAWLTLASSRGDEVAIDHKDRLWQVMTQVEKQRAVALFDELESFYADDLVTTRLMHWYRKEFRGPMGTRYYASGNPASVVINFRKKFETALLGELFPSYDVLYRDFRVLDSPAEEDQVSPRKE